MYFNLRELSSFDTGIILEIVGLKHKLIKYCSSVSTTAIRLIIEDLDTENKQDINYLFLCEYQNLADTKFF
jgi:hypothetical protein